MSHRAVGDAELLQKVEEVTAERDSLLGQLAPRRKQEAAALARLENERNSAEADIKRLEARLVRDAEEMAAAERRREVLQRGLSPFGGFWARVGEPIVLCTLILSTCLAMGASSWSWRMVVIACASFAAGTALRLVLRRRHG